MADEGLTLEGMDVLRASEERFPDELTAMFKLIAEDHANKLKVRAQELLLSQTHGTGATAAAIAVEADIPNQMYAVTSISPSQYPKNLVLWLEHGTIHQEARPYMRPAADAERQPYITAIEENLQKVIDLVFGAAA